MEESEENGDEKRNLSLAKMKQFFKSKSEGL